MARRKGANRSEPRPRREHFKRNENTRNQRKLVIIQDLLDHETPLGFTYKDYDHRWIVVDRDPERTNGGGHSRESFNTALVKARANEPVVKVAWSNPCFEIWFLLHYEYRNTAIDRDELYRGITRLIGKTYKKSDGNMYAFLESRLPTAVKNADNLQKDALERGLSPADTNPGTTVHTLISELLGI